MSLEKRLLFATLFAIAASTAAGRVKDHGARFAAPNLSTWVVPAAGPLPWYGRQRATNPSPRRDRFSTTGELPPAALVPIQFKNSKDLGVGKLLVASRGLGDPHFAKTVILLVHYDEKGVVGLVLNRRTDVPISRVLDLKDAKDRSDPVYLGGPVEPSAVFGVFQSSSKIEKAESIFGGVYLISDRTLFEQTIAARPDSSVFHVYLGYAGWTQDQLRAEVKLGAWFIFPADATTVFNSDPNSLWLEKIQDTELQLARSETFVGTTQPAMF